MKGVRKLKVVITSSLCHFLFALKGLKGETGSKGAVGPFGARGAVGQKVGEQTAQPSIQHHLVLVAFSC